MEKGYRIRGLHKRQDRGPSGLKDEMMDAAYDRHFEEKASMAEAMIFMMDKLRRQLWILIALHVVTVGAAVFFIYNKML